MYNLEKCLGLLSGIVIGGAQLIYLFNTLKKKVTPSVLSWFGWACLMGTSVVSQAVTIGWQWSLMGTLCSTVGSLTIATVALLSKNYSFRVPDLVFLLLGAGCVAIYLYSSDPWITTIFAIIADALLAIPTFKKAFFDPASERSVAWILGVISATLGLLACMGHNLIYFLFPIYLFLFNGFMVWVTRFAPVQPAA